LHIHPGCQMIRTDCVEKASSGQDRVDMQTPARADHITHCSLFQRDMCFFVQHAGRKCYQLPAEFLLVCTGNPENWRNTRGPVHTNGNSGSLFFARNQSHSPPECITIATIPSEKWKAVEMDSPVKYSGHVQPIFSHAHATGINIQSTVLLVSGYHQSSGFFSSTCSKTPIGI
jgi:hypothetical protein